MPDPRKVTYHCTACDHDFQPRKWDCELGGHHTIPPKTYYTHAANLRTYVSAEERITLEDGRSQIMRPRLIEFSRGSYTTSDPEDQYALDQHTGMITVEEWRRIHIDPKELIAMKERELKAREERLVRAENELLANVKLSKEAPSRAEYEKGGKAKASA